ncbi:MAG: CarD family transcriptional regulator [Alphaproteobacteria bacterium]|nr:CarD family transcriptional regulator [Alphaproteobacteria bacterium]
MATKAKVKVNAKTSKKSAPAKKAAVKKAVAKKPDAKKAVVKKPVAKKAAPKAATKKPAVKAVAKPVLKMVAKKVEAKKPVAPVAKASAAPKADTRHTLDRAPSMQNKAPLSSVGRQQQQGGRTMFVVPPQPSNGRKNNFAVGEYVVYPTHGVGKITGHEVERIGEHELKVFVIVFEKDKMTLRVPVGRAEAAGLRSISSTDQIGKALATLKGRAKIARGMWSRRAQEYEAKINSGNLVAIAEVVRDLHKNVDQSERSYSERMIYETAMHRLCGEVAASERVDIKDAQDRLLKVLRKQAAMAA